MRVGGQTIDFCMFSLSKLGNLLGFQEKCKLLYFMLTTEYINGSMNLSLSFEPH